MFSNKSVRWLQHGLGLVLLGLAQLVPAQTISPVLLNFSPSKHVVTVNLSNPSEQTMTFQTQVLQWHQEGGVDVYEDSPDLLIVPAIAQVAAGANQIFRVMVRRPLPTGAEAAYRVVIEDVGTSAAPPDGVGLVIHLSHRLPVFVHGASNGPPQVQLGACPAPAPAACLRLTNAGEQFVQVRQLSWSSGDWHQEQSLNTRVLAGAWWQWTTNLPADLTAPVQVQAQTSAGNFAWTLPRTGAL